MPRNRLFKFAYTTNGIRLYDAADDDDDDNGNIDNCSNAPQYYECMLYAL